MMKVGGSVFDDVNEVLHMDLGKVGRSVFECAHENGTKSNHGGSLISV